MSVRAKMDSMKIIFISLFCGLSVLLIDPSMSFFISFSSFHDQKIAGLPGYHILRTLVVSVLVFFFLSLSQKSYRTAEVYGQEYDSEKNSKIMDILPMAVIFLDTKGNISFINRQILEMTGYEEDQISGKKWFDQLIPEESREQLRPFWDSLISGETDSVNDLEVPVITASGSRRFLLWNAISFTDDNGDLRGILTSGKDITEMRTAQKALLLDESRLEALAELNLLTSSTLNDVLYFSLEKAVELTESLVGYIAFVDEDERTVDMYAWSKRSMELCNVDKVQNRFHFDEMGIWGDPIRQRRPIITNDYKGSYSSEKRLPEGHIDVNNHLCIPIFSGERIVMIAGVGNKDDDYNSSDVRQLTLLMQGTWKSIERKENEDKIKAYSEELARNNRELESLDRMKDEFMANITHELKTPLTPIKGYSDLLLEGHLGKLDDDQAKSISVIQENADRLYKLIDSLLYMQNIHSGNMQYHLDSIDLIGLLDSVSEEMMPHASEKSISLTKRYNEILPFICGNRTYLEQVFSHILENSLKFTPSGGSITISASREEKNVHVIVKDTGIGISENEMPHIFKRFYQADGSLTRRHGGNGLGLYLCKSIVEAHSGSIMAVSEEGKGTELHVVLPFIE